MDAVTYGLPPGVAKSSVFVPSEFLSVNFLFFGGVFFFKKKKRKKDHLTHPYAEGAGRFAGVRGLRPSGNPTDLWPNTFSGSIK
jgi:hypothetical protein